MDGQRNGRIRAALAGLLAAATALAVGELVAGASSRLAPPVITVGNRVIDAVPRPVKDFAIETFGTNDKIALLVGIYSIVALLGLALGSAAQARFWIGAAGIAAFGAVGVWAAAQEAGAPWWAGLPSILGAIAGVAVLRLLIDRSTLAPADRPVAPEGATSPATHPPGTGEHPDEELADASTEERDEVAEVADLAPIGATAGTTRRAFLATAGAVVAAAGATAAAGRWLQGRFSAAGSRLAVMLPRASREAPALDPAVAFEDEGISPFLTPNADFYRIDVNLTVPQLVAEDWSLEVKGMVDEPFTVSYDDVLAMDLVEERITLTCVSNEVGGGLVGTATWLGVPLVQLLERAGVQEDADQVVGRAFDGFTTGFPVEAALDGRAALLAVGMNGEPLPLAHGFPARLIVPGLYGYVSATKWITEIELTRFDAFDQYWVERDWSADGVIKTMSRIDTPRGLQRIDAGPAVVAGVAWAQLRGIERVEVRVDDGPWQEAELAEQDSLVTWRQWRFEWEATPGRHQITCRATDGTGEVQTEERARPFPDGASGWHSVATIVS
jgi:DMSO/TMAO reductase YedYZ molybdopterin-dependent catalytic subunit